MTNIHSCSYHCNIPACIKAQRDDLVKKYVATGGAGPVAWSVQWPSDVTANRITPNYDLAKNGTSPDPTAENFNRAFLAVLPAVIAEWGSGYEKAIKNAVLFATEAAKEMK